MKNYYELDDDFSKVYLEDSYILKINETHHSLEFLMDFVLTETNPLYIKPKEHEQYCFKKGIILFEKIKKIKWEEKHFIASQDTSGEIDYGNIDSLIMENDEYIIEGDFGKTYIKSDPPIIIFEN